jgi:hypothetical protein
MPYGIIPVDKKFMVIDTTTGRTFSKKALPKRTAQKQRIALAISSSKRENKPVSSFFV